MPPQGTGSRARGAFCTAYRTSSALALTTRANQVRALASDTERWAPPLVALLGLFLLPEVVSY
jgi:hypothetical protein